MRILKGNSIERCDELKDLLKVRNADKKLLKAKARTRIDGGGTPCESTAQALRGGIAQLGEHLLCKQGVNGSIPFISTTGLKRFEP